MTTYRKGKLLPNNFLTTVLVTTVASESAFSTSGRVISPHRSSLTPKMIEALMCMQAWSRADMLGNM